MADNVDQTSKLIYTAMPRKCTLHHNEIKILNQNIANLPPKFNATNEWCPDKFYSYLLFYICVRSYVAVSKAKFAENVHIVLSCFAWIAFILTSCVFWFDRRQEIIGLNFAENQAVVFIGWLGACVLNTPRDIYNDVLIIDNDHYIIVIMSFCIYIIIYTVQTDRASILGAELYERTE